jgi:site-specific DNA-adenine methylase
MDGERKWPRDDEADPLERVTSRADDVEKAAHGVFGYAAGKSIIASKLVKMFPAHKSYTEPFCGSAAMFFVKEPAPHEVLSDSNKEVAFAHQALKTLTPAEFKQLEKMNWVGSRASFVKLYKSSPTGKIERLHKFLYLARFSYGKMRRSWDPNSEGKRASTSKRVERLQPRYKNATILHSDYAPVLKKYDGKDAFHFLDPPYAGYNVAIGEKDFDEPAFRKALDGIKGRFLLTYGTKGKLDTSGYEVKRLRQPRTIRTMRGVGGSQFITHLLVSNFKLAKKSLGPGVEIDDVMQIVDVDEGGERIMVTGSRTSVSVPDDLAPARAWKHDDTLCAYPAEPGPVSGEARVRFLEKQWALDVTFPVNDVTVGWSLAAQRSEVAALPAAVAKAFCVEGSRFFLPLTCGVGACETPREALAEAVVKIDALEVELGLQTETVHEYFLSKGGELGGQLTVVRDEERPLGDKLPWIATLVSSNIIPNAVLKGGPMPPDGISALPQSLERLVPPEFCYWQHRGDEARKMRDALAESRFFDGQNLVLVDGEFARVVTKLELYEPPDPVPARGEWPIAKALEILPARMKLVEVFSLGAEDIAKAGDKAAVYVDAGDAVDGALDLLAKALSERAGHYVVTAIDSEASRAALAPLGRLFHFRAGAGVGADAVKRVFVASFGVRSDDVVWLDKAKSPRELLETLGPPPQWSGAAAALIGPENRAAMQAAWRDLSSSEKKNVQAAFERNFSKGDMTSGGPGTLRPAVDQPKRRAHHLSVVKAETSGDEHFVFGIVLEPDVVDAQKDVYSAAEVRDAAHKYMAEFQNRGLMHKELVNKHVDLLESYLAPASFTIGDQSVKKGTWLMAMRVKDGKLWNEVKKGNLTGFSIGGSANRQVDPKATSKYYARKADAKKKVEFQGIPIVIDRPKGFVQEGTSEDGTPWTREYKTDYGFIPSTKGGDGEGLDVFVGPKADSHNAFWFTQTKADGSFDEYKVVLGADDLAEAKKIYLDHIPAKFLSDVREGSVHQIKALLNQEPDEPLSKALGELADEAGMSDVSDVTKATVAEVMRARIKASEASKLADRDQGARRGGVAVSSHDRELHAKAGEAHLAAARSMEPHAETKEAIAYHLGRAATHAKAAGREWDESKHPRDENGKFG